MTHSYQKAIFKHALALHQLHITELQLVAVPVHGHPASALHMAGRRPGLKIPWVVIPVPVRFRSAAFVKRLISQFDKSFFIFDKGSSRPFLLDLCGIIPHNRFSRLNFFAEIEMGVSIGSCSNCTMSQPFLDSFQVNAVCIKQTCAAMPLRYNNDKRKKPLF